MLLKLYLVISRREVLAILLPAGLQLLDGLLVVALDEGLDNSLEGGRVVDQFDLF